MAKVFPQKAAYVGDEGLAKLIHDGRTDLNRHSFPRIKGAALLVILKFAFGHGCTDDPLYPWISKTLQNQKIVDPGAREKRLEKKALTWLDHVLNRIGQGGRI